MSLENKFDQAKGMLCKKAMGKVTNDNKDKNRGFVEKQFN